MKISDYVESQIKGLWGTDFDENGIPVIKTNNLTYEGNIDYSEICKRNITKEQAKGCYLRPGDLLIEKSGGTKTHSVGYVSYFEGDENKFVCNNFILALRPKNTINSKFLFYQIQFKYESNQFSDCFNKTTGIQNLKVKDYLAKEIKIYSSEEQEKIVKELDTVRSTINKNKQILEKYDTLIKSRFIEMFGDPVTNPKNWEIRKLSELAEYWNGLTYKPENVNENGTIVLRSSNIQDNALDFNDIVRVDCKIKEKHFVKNNDILMCSRNGSAKLVGKVALIKNLEEKTSFGAFMMIIRSNYHQYLFTYFQTDAFRRQIKTGATTTVNQITNNMLNQISIPLPPKELQNDFAAFVQQIDKSKFEMAIYEKLWYNYQIWRKKMGLFRGIFDLFSTWTISDKFGLGAGFLYADYAWEKANERELNKMKAGVTQTITNYINENRKLLNDDLIQILNTFINSIANCNKFNANSILSELKNFLMHKCAYHSCIIEILNHSIEAIESIPEDNLDDGVKIQALQKTKNVIDCSDSNQLPILLKDLFSFYDENGIEVENKEELFDKFESLRKEYLA